MDVIFLLALFYFVILIIQQYPGAHMFDHKGRVSLALSIHLIIVLINIVYLNLFCLNDSVADTKHCII